MVLRVPASKPLGGSMIDEVFHTLGVNQLSTKNLYERIG